MNDQPSPTVDIIPYLYYRDVAAALEWLTHAFGFVEQLRDTTHRGSTHAEMALGGRHIMLGGGGNDPPPSPAVTGAATQGVFVYVDDVAALHARAKAAGARLSGDPADHGYGLTFTAYDLDAHPWFFAQRAAL